MSCAIGFGISTPEQAKKTAALADGAIVKLVAQYGKDSPERVGRVVGEFARELAQENF